MKKAFRFFLFVSCLCLLACNSANHKDNRDASPGMALVAPEVAATVEITKAILNPSGLVVNKVAGHVYCGEGPQQRPASHARLDLASKEKVLTTTTTNMDGSYELIYKNGFRDGYQITINAKCGQTKTNLPTGLVKQETRVDFWIK